MSVKNVFILFITAMCSFAIVYFQSTASYNEPTIAYRVYLEGKDIGLIKSRSELEDYINLQQEKLKQKYNVDKIYIPNDIDIVKDVTYDDDLSSIQDIYNKINDIAPWTIKGYEITIDKTNSTVYENDDNVASDTPKIIKLAVLNKDIFVKAVKNVILSFVSSEDYDAFLKDEQIVIETTGQLIEDIYIEDKITIKEAYITVSDDIYMDEDELTRYLIFGNHSEDGTYVVKAGDTIEEISNDNKMSVNELLIANSETLKSETSLLYVGQKLNIGTLSPIFTTIVEKHVVTDQTVKYKTTSKYNNNKPIGYTKTLQEGVNGVTRVTQKVKMINGQIISAVIVSSDEIVPMVEKIVERGGWQSKRGDGEWVWPTNIPYIISSRYGWRWGKLHAGLDICGTGLGSPIYAARDGVVTRMGWMNSGGYFVELKHDNGYYSHYLHMLNDHGNSVKNSSYNSSAAKYVKVGDYVKAGTVIGDMGNSGFTTGPHLHFGIWYGQPYNGGTSYNPLLFY